MSSPERAERFEEAIAKQEIVELRMLYARATDLIGTNSKDNVSKGREIYHRIFASNAKVSAEGIDPVHGPDAWVEIVEDALGTYDATQHLIGTPLIGEVTLPDANGKGGKATMTSYLQAWHSTPEHSLYMFMGTYHDTVEYTAENGWQITAMHLENVADEVRDVEPRAGGLSTIGQ